MSKTKAVPTQAERLNQSAPTLSTPGIASILNQNFFFNVHLLYLGSISGSWPVYKVKERL